MSVVWYASILLPMSYRNNEIKYNFVIVFFPKLVPYKHNAVGQSATYKTLLSHEFESCWGFFFHVKTFFGQIL